MQTTCRGGEGDVGGWGNVRLDVTLRLNVVFCLNKVAV